MPEVKKLHHPGLDRAGDVGGIDAEHPQNEPAEKTGQLLSPVPWCVPNSNIFFGMRQEIYYLTVHTGRAILRHGESDAGRVPL